MTYMFTHRTPSASYILLFFFNETATTEIYTLSLPDALPIHQDREYRGAARARRRHAVRRDGVGHRVAARDRRRESHRSEEHTAELQSQSKLLCRFLL